MAASIVLGLFGAQPLIHLSDTSDPPTLIRSLLFCPIPTCTVFLATGEHDPRLEMVRKPTVFPTTVMLQKLTNL